MTEIKFTPSAELEAKLQNLVNDPNVVLVDDIATAALWFLIVGASTYEEHAMCSTTIDLMSSARRTDDPPKIEPGSGWLDTSVYPPVARVLNNKGEWRPPVGPLVQWRCPKCCALRNQPADWSNCPQCDGDMERWET